MKDWKITLIVIVVLSIFVGICIFSEHQRSLKDTEFPRLTPDIEINGIVKKGDINAGTFYIELYDSIKFSLTATRNYLYDTPELYMFLKAGDRLVKQSGTDTLYVYRKNREYYFVIGKFINEKPR